MWVLPKCGATDPGVQKQCPCRNDAGEVDIKQLLQKRYNLGGLPHISTCIAVLLRSA